MRLSIYTLVAAASAVSAQSSTAVAPQVTGNPIGVQYQATLPDKAGPLGSAVRGVFKASSAGDGKGVAYQIEVHGLPDASLGPFMYHIHEKPVPADGNCTGTGAHLDPYKRGETPPCDASKPETCQTGDLSGKHGNLTTSPAESKAFTDLYTSTDPSSLSFLGSLSVVVHSNNKTRLTCANFTLASPNPGSSSVVSSGYALPTVNGTHIATGTASATITVPASATTFHSGTPTQPSGPGSSSPPGSAAGKTVVAGAGAAVLAGALALVL